MALFNLGVLYLDNDMGGKDPITRNQQSVEFLRSFVSKVKVSPDEQGQIDEYIETAQKAIESEQKRRDRDKRRATREAQKRQEMEAQPAPEGNEGAPPPPVPQEAK